MRIATISAAESSPPPHRKPRDEGRTGRTPADDPSINVILDLSVEAMKQLGREPLSLARPERPFLFVYDETGAFAYDSPALPDEPPEPEIVAAEEPAAPPPPPMPSVVTFDGRL